METIAFDSLRVYNGNTIASDDEYQLVSQSFNSGTNPFNGDVIIYFDEDFEDPTSSTQEMVFDDSTSFTITKIDIIQYADAEAFEEIGTVTCNKSSANNQTTFTWNFNSTSVKAYAVEIYCTFGASKYTITYSIADANWADKVVISPLSPIEVEKGNTTTVQVAPKTGYYFSGTDSCDMFIEDQLERVPFTLTSDGKMYLEMDESWSNLTLSLEFTVTQGEPPVTNKRTNFYTVYAPTDENMKKINNTVFIDNNDVINKFISYKKFWCNIPTDGIAKMKAGNYDFNFEAPVVHGNIIDVDCGSVTVEELHHSLLDYSPFSRLTIYLPFIGFMDLDDKMVMGKTVRVNYRVDVLSGRCLAEVYTMIDDSTESCIASYAGTIASDEPLSQGQVNYKGGYELMTSMQLGELTPFILVNTQVPLDSGSVNLDGLPVEEVKRVGDCTGYIKYSFINASGCSGTDAEKTEIENLLKSGINIEVVQTPSEDTGNDGF
jgi:hypothetical protein